jgi:hypothetical protein
MRIQAVFPLDPPPTVETSSGSDFAVAPECAGYSDTCFGYSRNPRGFILSSAKNLVRRRSAQLFPSLHSLTDRYRSGNRP